MYSNTGQSYIWIRFWAIFVKELRNTLRFILNNRIEPVHGESLWISEQNIAGHEVDTHIYVDVFTFMAQE